MKLLQQHGADRARRSALLVLATLVTSGALALATSEYQLKAVFLFNFAQFVEWPTGAFIDSHAQLNVCILGEDPFGSELETVMHGESIGGRSIAIQRLEKAGGVEHCHLVYINQPEGELERTLRQLKGKPVLTVGDTQAFTSSGGMIRFYMDGNRIRLLINPKAADEAKLRLSSKLLRSSQIVAMEAGNAR